VCISRDERGGGTTDRWGLSVSESGEWGPSVGFNERQGSLFFLLVLNEFGSCKPAPHVGFIETQGLCTRFTQILSSSKTLPSA
jgi:hypothetical protein